MLRTRVCIIEVAAQLVAPITEVQPTNLDMIFQSSGLYFIPFLIKTLHMYTYLSFFNSQSRRYVYVSEVILTSPSHLIFQYFIQLQSNHALTFTHRPSTFIHLK